MDIFESARQCMPSWVGWGTVMVHVPAAFIFSVAAGMLGGAAASISLYRLKRSGWAERARLIFPARQVTGLNLLVLPIFLGAMARLYDGPMARVSQAHVMILSGAAALAGALIVRYSFERRFSKQPMTFLYWLQGMATISVVLVPHFFVAGAMIALLPGTINLLCVVILVAGTAAFAFLAWGGSIFLARALGLARPASGRLAAIMETAVGRVGVKPRSVYIIRWPKANAFAFPLAQRLAFTDTALREMKDDELAAIAAHELGHLAESRLVSLARSSGVLVLLPIAAVRPITGQFSLYAFLAVIFLVLIGIMALRRLARRMEERADQVAHIHEGQAGTYARALERLYEINMIPAVLPGKRRVHPHLYDRLKAAGIEPAYPRPKPPSRALSFLGILVSIMIVAALSLALNLALLMGGSFARTSEQRLVYFIAASGGEASELGDLAFLKYGKGDLDCSIRLYKAAGMMNQDSPYYPANLAIVLAAAGLCRDAEAHAAEAKERLKHWGQHPADFPLIRKAEEAVEMCRSRQH